MSETTFLGYMRPNGQAGARNYVLLMPINRSLNFIAASVKKMTNGTRHFEIPAETGRTKADREVIVRTMTGLMQNANVGGIVLLAVKPVGAAEVRDTRLRGDAGPAEKHDVVGPVHQVLQLPHLIRHGEPPFRS